MRVNISAKNLNISENVKAVIEKKFKKLEKYFSDDVVANVMISQEGKLEKMEATIKIKGTTFRAEEIVVDSCEGIDKVVDKLSTQISRFKKKLIKKHHGSKEINFDFMPEMEENEVCIVRNKKFDLVPMTAEEAILQMELLQHNFFVFLNIETDCVNVVYKRKAKDYGLLETTY